LRLHRLEFFKFLEFLSKLAPNVLAAGHDDADRFIDGAMQHDEMRLLTMCKSAFPVFSHYCCLLQNVAQMIRRPAGFLEAAAESADSIGDSGPELNNTLGIYSLTLYS
jgi:hypothetical protein